MPSSRFRVSDLFLAFRQAKNVISSEFGATGMFQFAKFEDQLSERIRALRHKLSGNQWFDHVRLGRIIVVPKATELEFASPDDIVEIGKRDTGPMHVSARLQLEPDPEFSITEVLYLWEFGGALESLLTSDCVGYRLDRVSKEGSIDRYSRRIFEYWPAAFERYRTEPIDVARQRLARGESVVITSTDIISFFDSIDPSFMLHPAFIERLGSSAAAMDRPFSKERYRQATESLLSKFAEFRKLRNPYGCEELEHVGIPIGATTSRVIANLAVAGLDSFIKAQPNVVLYRRYVDDIVIISVRDEHPEPLSRSQLLSQLFPSFQEDSGLGCFRVPDTDALFRLKNEKTRIHALSGTAGIEFLDAVGQSFALVSSERRAFIGDIDRLENELETIELFSEAAGGEDKIPRLRDADRFTLRRYMTKLVVRGLEQSVILLGQREASRLLERKTKRILAILDGARGFDEFEFVISLYRIAHLCNCEAVIARLEHWFDRHLDESMDSVKTAVWNGQQLPLEMAIAGIRSYLRQRLEETRAGSVSLLAIDEDRGTHESNSVLLWRTGLRHLDREDEAALLGAESTFAPVQRPSHSHYLSNLLRRDEMLQARLDAIDYFLRRSRDLGETIWADVSPVSMFLYVKPPKYMDVARRLLAKSELEDPAKDIGVLIDWCVDALRGTRYSRRPFPTVAAKISEGTVTVELVGQLCTQDVRIIVANSVSDATAFADAARGTPKLDARRLRRLSSILREILNVARQAKKKGKQSLALFPELSIPRKWIRAIANYAAAEQLALVMGAEYHITPKGLVNHAVGFFPGGFATGAFVTWTKRHPARKEATELAKLGLRFKPAPESMRRLIVASSHGRLGVLICSELLDVQALAELFGQTELILVPAWNEDTSSFEHAAHASASLYLHSFVCVANDSVASDSRIVAPIKEPRHEREWSRLIHRHEDRIIWGDLPLHTLTELHRHSILQTHQPGKDGGRIFRPLPPAWPGG
jgi:predicted amidohydrolase